MATITSAGLGSGIDVEGLITKLMAAERAPITQIQTQESAIQTKLSAYGTLKSSLSTLSDAAKALQTKSNFSSWTANVADTAAASATVSSSASAGSYSLNVTQLAQAQKTRSAGYDSSSTTIATGTLQIDLGTLASDGTTSTFTADSTRSFSVTIDSSNNTLSGLKDAINAAKSGVTASIVNDGSKSRLVLTSDSTGASNAFKLSGLTGFDFDPAATSTSTLTSTQAAQDAKFTLDGIAVTRSSNTVSDVIDGVTLTLKSKSTADTTLTVASDTAAITTKINAFVTAYNNTVGLMASQSNYNSTTKTAGPLNGDASIRNIQSQLRSIMSGSVGSGSVSRLSDVGIQVGVDGKLTVDSTKLGKALSDPTKDVASLFATNGTTSGLADQLVTRITNMNDTGGILTSRTDGLNSTIKTMDKSIAALEARMTSIEARYRKQFTAMDATISSLNSTASYLTAQLSKL